MDEDLCFYMAWTLPLAFHRVSVLDKSLSLLCFVSPQSPKPELEISRVGCPRELVRQEDWESIRWPKATKATYCTYHTHSHQIGTLSDISSAIAPLSSKSRRDINPIPNVESIDCAVSQDESQETKKIASLSPSQGRPLKFFFLCCGSL